MKKPKIGDKIYIGTSLHISRGSDDVQGGLATIKRVIIHDYLPKNHSNYYAVEVEEVPGVEYGYSYLLEKQEEYKERFGDRAAYPDPDEDRPWIENGDYVNGKVWEGGDIW